MYGDSLSVDLDDVPLHGEYHMAEFAKKYFREAQRNRRSHTHICSHSHNKMTCVTDCCLSFAHRDQKAKKKKEGRDPGDMVKFSKVKQLHFPHETGSIYLYSYACSPSFSTALFIKIFLTLCMFLPPSLQSRSL